MATLPNHVKLGCQLSFAFVCLLSLFCFSENKGATGIVIQYLKEKKSLKTYRFSLITLKFRNTSRLFISMSPSWKQMGTSTAIISAFENFHHCSQRTYHTFKVEQFNTKTVESMSIPKRWKYTCTFDFFLLFGKTKWFAHWGNSHLCLNIFAFAFTLWERNLRSSRPNKTRFSLTEFTSTMLKTSRNKCCNSVNLVPVSHYNQ